MLRFRGLLMKPDTVLPVDVLGKLVKMVKPVKPLSLLGLTTFATSTGIASITSFTFYQTVQSGKTTQPSLAQREIPTHRSTSSADTSRQIRCVNQSLELQNLLEETNP